MYDSNLGWEYILKINKSVGKNRKENVKNKPSSAKKHKALRRKRRADWDQSREEMEQRDRLADDAAHEFIREALNVAKD